MGQRRVTFCFHVKWNFRWNWRNVVADQSNPQSFAQSFDQSLVSELKYDIKTKQDVLHRILCKAADLNWRPVQEKGVYSDTNWTAQRLQMAERKLEKLGNYVWHDSGSITTKVCSQNGRKQNAMFESHVVTSVERTSFDLWFDEFLSNLPL